MNDGTGIPEDRKERSLITSPVIVKPRRTAARVSPVAKVTPKPLPPPSMTVAATT